MDAENCTMMAGILFINEVTSPLVKRYLEFIRRHTTPRARKGSILVGALFAFAVVVGGQVYETNSIAGLATTPEYALSRVALGLASAALAAALALLLAVAQSALAERDTKRMPDKWATWPAFAAVAVVLFLAWTPCLLAYWPGLFSYDIPTQTDYIASGKWTTQQPPLHTLIWALFLHLEGLCGLRAITWYALTQEAFLACSFACVLRFLAERHISRVLWIVALAFFALNPVIALFAIIPVKDALLAGVLCILSVQTARLVDDPSAFTRRVPSCFACGLCMLACCLLRANMLVAVVLFAGLAIILFKQERKRVAILCAVPVVLALTISGPVYSAAGITPGSSAIASVPFQQVVNVVRTHHDELSREELSAVREVLPVKAAVKSYNPRFADSVVRLFKGKEVGAAAMRDKLVDFAWLWLSLIPRYPIENIDAFLSLNVPYWYPFASTPDPYSQRAYIETSVWKETPNYDYDETSLAPGLREAYERIADYSALDNPLCGIVFSPSSVIWALILSFFLLYCSKSRRRALLVVLPLLFWLSFMIGPVSNMRYVFPLFCLYPILACAALEPDRIFPGPGGENR